MIERNKNKPIIILVCPQMAENVGATARAMLNCDLHQLRLVKPRENHLSKQAIAMASGADIILKTAQVFDDFQEAISDLNVVYATTARKRDMTKNVITAEQAVLLSKNYITENKKVGFIFGPERTGLDNDHVAMANAIIEIPLNPKHCSLNLAQAVLIVGYEWFKSNINTKQTPTITNDIKPATLSELENFFYHLETELDNCGYFRITEKKPKMVRNLRNIFSRANLTEKEINSLHGVVKGLVTYRHTKKNTN